MFDDIHIYRYTDIHIYIYTYIHIYITPVTSLAYPMWAGLTPGSNERLIAAVFKYDSDSAQQDTRAHILQIHYN